MNKEEILRTKAQHSTKAAFKIANSQDGRGSHDNSKDIFGEISHKFIQLFNKDLAEVITPSNKFIFLQEARLWLNNELQEHLSNCKSANCEYKTLISLCLFPIEQELELLPQEVNKNPTTAPLSRNRIFISYSHKDTDYLHHFKRHFGTLKKVDFWEDSRIKAGDIWREEIKRAIQSAKIAILFLSADFFSSDFIEKHELPPLLEAAQKDGATILCVYLRPFFADGFPEITQYQGINNPKNPIAKMNDYEKDEMWTALVERVNEILKD